MQTANDICKNVCMSAHTANQAQKAPAPVITFPSYNGAAARPQALFPARLASSNNVARRNIATSFKQRPLPLEPP